ncbi:hypothetical protein ABC304_08095 [Microbacterium sp. 1P10UB]|uniref:hypothetical protein n=1 Tax=unclassified Microbacterium TaxID=2609290 RepID=UPI0039A02C9A
MSRIARTSALPVFALTAVLALAGCASPAATTAPDEAAPQESASQESAAPETEAPDASGTTITGDGYSYTAPEGWEDAKDQAGTTGADSLAADLTDTDGFSDNVNVIKSPAGEISADDVETLGVQELEGAGATDVQVLDRENVAGSESAHLTALFSSEGAEYRIDQYYLTNSGQTYVVTFSFSTTVEEPERTEVADSVLSTWTWA